MDQWFLRVWNLQLSTKKNTTLQLTNGNKRVGRSFIDSKPFSSAKFTGHTGEIPEIHLQDTHTHTGGVDDSKPFSSAKFII